MGYKKLVKSGNLIETYEYKYDPIPRKPGRVQGKVCSKRTKTRNRRADNLLRIKRYFARIVRCNLHGGEGSLFVTFTMYETVPLRKAYHSFSRCIQRLRNQYGKSFRYVAVPEFQGDITFSGKRKLNGGAVHFHALFWGLPITPRQERQKRYIQWCWRRGYVDCVQTDGSVKIVGYLTKYLLKSLQAKRLGNSKAYVCSRNVMRPVSLPFATSTQLFYYINEVVGEGAQPSQVRSFETQWLGTCKYSRYVV